MNQSLSIPELEEVKAILDRFDVESVPGVAWLAGSKLARELASRLGALSAVLLGRSEAAQQTLRDKGTPTSSWLTSKEGLSKREAAAAVFQAKELHRNAEVGKAALAGQISVNQARSISKVLHDLPVPAEKQGEAELALLELAETLDAQQLLASGPQVLRQVDSNAERILEEQLQRQHEAAWRERSLRFHTNGGSLVFSGSLPLVEGAQWQAILRSHIESQRRASLERRDPLAQMPTPDQRRADGLLAMIRLHGEPGSAGTGRPQVMVVLDYAQLQAAAAWAGTIDGQPLSAGDLRRLCCDTDLIPAVLGGASEPLDVGRARRLVTGPIRAALTLRDQGCVFPGCDTHPTACEAHHCEPWWAGGKTSLDNLVLLCHHHHGLLEPAKYGIRDQWQVRIRDQVELIPPSRIDPQRKPIPARPATPSLATEPANNAPATNPPGSQKSQDEQARRCLQEGQFPPGPGVLGFKAGRGRVAGEEPGSNLVGTGTVAHGFRGG